MRVLLAPFDREFQGVLKTINIYILFREILDITKKKVQIDHEFSPQDPESNFFGD